MDATNHRLWKHVKPQSFEFKTLGRVTMLTAEVWNPKLQGNESLEVVAIQHPDDKSDPRIGRKVAVEKLMARFEQRMKELPSNPKESRGNLKEARGNLKEARSNPCVDVTVGGFLPKTGDRHIPLSVCKVGDASSCFVVSRGHGKICLKHQRCW